MDTWESLTKIETLKRIPGCDGILGHPKHVPLSGQEAIENDSELEQPVVLCVHCWRDREIL